MAKKCSVNGCNRPVFSKGKCIFHKQNKPIRKVSKKRQKETTQYTQARKEFIQEILEATDGSIFCMFCNERVYEDPDVHHTDGREEWKLIDTEHWIPAHRKCHMEYHDLPINKISWWNTYLENIRKIQPDVYEKELIKMNK